VVYKQPPLHLRLQS